MIYNQEEVKSIQEKYKKMNDEGYTMNFGEVAMSLVLLSAIVYGLAWVCAIFN